MQHDQATGAPVDRDISKSARTRGRILDAAAQILSTHGYTGTRLADIAELARLRAPTLYYYFPSREAVVAEVLRIGFATVEEEIRQRLAQLPADAGPIARLDATIDAHISLVCESSARANYCRAHHRNLAHVPESVRKACAEQLRSQLDLWHGLIDDLHCDGYLRVGLDPKYASMFCLGVIGGCPSWWRSGRDDPRTLRQHARRLIINGIVTDEQRRVTAASIHGNST